MPPFVLRPATSEDSPAIHRLIRSVRINPLDLNWQRFVVATNSQDGLIGCGQVKIHNNSEIEPLRELASIAVSPEWRGRGIARGIIEYLLAATPAPIYLTCRESLETFYQRFGFYKIQGQEMPVYYRRIKRLIKFLRTFHIMPEDILVMKLQD